MENLGKITVSLVLAGSALVSGCASVGYGDPNYSCSGIPGGLKCMSALEVYEATDNGNELYTMNESEQLQPVGDASYTESTRDEEKGDAKSPPPKPVHPVVARVPVPDVNQDPIPVRTPATVMKIWVAPWEDENGDLITSGYVHTEVEPRKWQIGLPTPRTTTTLRPLQN